MAARASEIAPKTYALPGCAGFARVDLMLCQDGGELYVLELNPIPGLTETSLPPQALKRRGSRSTSLSSGCLAAVRPV